MAELVWWNKPDYTISFIFYKKLGQANYSSFFSFFLLFLNPSSVPLPVRRLGQPVDFENALDRKDKSSWR